MPLDLGDPADLAFARAEIRASVARLSNTVRAVTEELEAIQRHLIALDKRGAAEPSAERLLDEDEVDITGTSACRTPSGTLHFLYVSESAKRYQFVITSLWSSQPSDWKPVASLPDGYKASHAGAVVR